MLCMLISFLLVLCLPVRCYSVVNYHDVMFTGVDTGNCRKLEGYHCVDTGNCRKLEGYHGFEACNCSTGSLFCDVYCVTGGSSMRVFYDENNDDDCFSTDQQEGLKMEGDDKGQFNEVELKQVFSQFLGTALGECQCALDVLACGIRVESEMTECPCQNHTLITKLSLINPIFRSKIMMNNDSLYGNEMCRCIQSDDECRCYKEYMCYNSMYYSSWCSHDPTCYKEYHETCQQPDVQCFHIARAPSSPIHYECRKYSIEKCDILQKCINHDDYCENSCPIYHPDDKGEQFDMCTYSGCSSCNDCCECQYCQQCDLSKCRDCNDYCRDFLYCAQCEYCSQCNDCYDRPNRPQWFIDEAENCKYMPEVAEMIIHQFMTMYVCMCNIDEMMPLCITKYKNNRQNWQCMTDTFLCNMDGVARVEMPKKEDYYRFCDNCNGSDLYSGNDPYSGKDFYDRIPFKDEMLSEAPKELFHLCKNCTCALVVIELTESDVPLCMCNDTEFILKIADEAAENTTGCECMDEIVEVMIPFMDIFLWNPVIAVGEIVDRLRDYKTGGLCMIDEYFDMQSVLILMLGQQRDENCDSYYEHMVDKHPDFICGRLEQSCDKCINNGLIPFSDGICAKKMSDCFAVAVAVDCKSFGLVECRENELQIYTYNIWICDYDFVCEDYGWINCFNVYSTCYPNLECQPDARMCIKTCVFPKYFLCFNGKYFECGTSDDGSCNESTGEYFYEVEGFSTLECINTFDIYNTFSGDLCEVCINETTYYTVQGCFNSGYICQILLVIIVIVLSIIFIIFFVLTICMSFQRVYTKHIVFKGYEITLFMNKNSGKCKRLSIENKYGRVEFSSTVVTENLRIMKICYNQLLQQIFKWNQRSQYVVDRVIFIMLSLDKLNCTNQFEKYICKRIKDFGINFLYYINDCKTFPKSEIIELYFFGELDIKIPRLLNNLYREELCIEDSFVFVDSFEVFYLNTSATIILTNISNTRNNVKEF